MHSVFVEVPPFLLALDEERRDPLGFAECVDLLDASGDDTVRIAFLFRATKIPHVFHPTASAIGGVLSEAEEMLENSRHERSNHSHLPFAVLQEI